jgi:hypothetical protein
MPRPLPPENAKKAAIQARYRQRLRERREPEADRVDTALAAAVAAYSDAIYRGLGSDDDRRVLRILVQSAISILRADGYDADSAVNVLRRRMTRVVRPDLEKLIADSRIVQRMTRR